MSSCTAAPAPPSRARPWRPLTRKPASRFLSSRRPSLRGDVMMPGFLLLTALMSNLNAVAAAARAKYRLTCKAGSKQRVVPRPPSLAPARFYTRSSNSGHHVGKSTQ